MFKFFKSVSCNKFPDAHAATYLHSYFLSDDDNIFANFQSTVSDLLKDSNLLRLE